MLRYRLDDLGWAQFEWLIQSLLKIQLGVGVEAWGGHGDHGCDAWSPGPLYFPLPNTQENGPFVFQAKFVEGANAAGADPDPALLKAVQREALRIAKRLTARTWTQEPRYYALLTNAVVSAELRDRLRSELTKAIPASQVVILDGNDVSALLDQHPAIRRAFPQLLSLRDLDTLLKEVVNHELLERSQAAKEAAREVVPVFVPTDAYGKAWRVLREHHFVVLEGPPEMGKSAIAWMVTLNLICDGWQGVVCDGPDDFFRGYDHAVKQVFVADDAFGRTEYDPGRGRQWEGNLHRAFTLLNPTHWLIWTSRRHILERARAAMDLQGTASRFPRPGEVLVDTTKLSPREKAFILYRHGRSARLEVSARDVIKTNASGIVLHEHFTPERVRRFVAEKLPALAAATVAGQIDQGQVAAQIRETIRNPTERMRKSFQALPEGHKWFLYALLEASGAYATPDEVARLYAGLCSAEASRPFEELRDELLESFVTEYRTPQASYLRWMHPSYRDLVIEELARDQAAHERFMTHMSLAGVKLAISDSGGARGERQLPLMGSEHSWVLLDARCVEIAGQGNRRAVHELLAALYEAYQAATSDDHRPRLARIMGQCLRVLRPIWSSETLSAAELQAYAEASEVADALEPLPSLDPSWSKRAKTLSECLEEFRRGYLPSAYDLQDWSDLVDFVLRYEPRFLRRPSTKLALTAEVAALTDLARLLSDPGEPDDADAARSDSALFGALSSALQTAASLASDGDDAASLRKLAERAVDTARKLDELANNMEAREGADENEDGSAWEGGALSSPGVDVAAVFSDF